MNNSTQHTPRVADSSTDPDETRGSGLEQQRRVSERGGDQYGLWGVWFQRTLVAQITERKERDAFEPR